MHDSCASLPSVATSAGSPETQNATSARDDDEGDGDHEGRPPHPVQRRGQLQREEPRDLPQDVLGPSGEAQPGAREHRRHVVAVRGAARRRLDVGEIGRRGTVPRDEFVDLGAR